AHREDQLEDLLAIGDHLDWFAASTEQIKNAHCLRKDPFTEAEMKDWLTKNQSATNKSRTVNGIKFENESEENLRSFAMLMKEVGEDFMDLPPRTYTSNCTKVECAVKEILGKDIGDRKSTRLNSSHVKISYAVFCLKKKKRR